MDINNNTERKLEIVETHIDREPLKDIIDTLNTKNRKGNYIGFFTNKGVDILFPSRKEVEKMMNTILQHKIKTQGQTLWDFFKDKCSVIVLYYNDDYDHSTLKNKYILNIPTEELQRFEELFFEVFPSREHFQCLSSIINE